MRINLMAYQQLRCDSFVQVLAEGVQDGCRLKTMDELRWFSNMDNHEGKNRQLGK